MSNPCIVTCAITGAIPTKADNPAVPVTPTEQIESTHEAFEAGASLVHIHVRNEDQSPVQIQKSLLKSKKESKNTVQT